MKRRIRILLALLLVCVLSVVGVKIVYSLPNEFSDEVGCGLYDCMLELYPHEDLAATSAVCVMLEWENWRSYTRVEVTPEQITIRSLSEKRDEQVWQVASTATPGKAYNLAIYRRGDWLGLAHDDAMLFQGKVPQAAGHLAGVTTKGGWTVQDARVQPLEPVAFADNFMRSSEEGGAWITRSGHWTLHSAWDDNPLGNAARFTDAAYSQNPFAWEGHGTDEPAFCTAGEPFWSDYTLSTAVKPAGNGAVGVAVNMTDPKNGLLIRWTPVTDPEVRGGELALYRLVDGESTLITRRQGGYLPGQWYQLAVASSLQGVCVLVDGQSQLTADGVTPWRGGVGLYAEGADGAVFDDVTVYGRTLNADLLRENQLIRLGRRIIEDKDMRKYLGDWQPYPGQPNMRLHRYAFTGDQRLSLCVQPAAGKAGKVCLILGNDGSNSESGYCAMIARDDSGNATYSLWRDDVRLLTKRGEYMRPDEDYVLRFWRVGDRLCLERDGRTVAEVRETRKMSGDRVAWLAEGGLARVRDKVAIGRNVLDYFFTDAPVDWVGEGQWQSTVRWACDTRWSFLGGWSHGDCALWHKKRFQGDHSFEAFVAPKMEYPNARVMYADRYCHMGITICGDGHNPRSGYAGLFGAPDAQGRPNRRTILMRDGVIVAQVNLFLPPKDEVHKQWSRLCLTKRGSTIEFWVDGARVLTYTDPQPLAGGVPGLWTTNNGLSIARARLVYVTAPQPRTDNRFALDSPAHPEWQNVGTPLTLDFPNACCSTGEPLRLMTDAKGVPAGEESPDITGQRITFTPRKVGVHWYRIYATDGESSSPSYHLLIPVFNPALGRDDSHTLSLYRFDEGKGTLVQDHGAADPPVNLRITYPPDARWMPEQGLTLCRPTLLKSTANAEKLMAIARNSACTIECWVSYATLYPPMVEPVFWEGNVCGWETGNGQRNFTFGFHSFHNMLAARPGANIKLDNTEAFEAPFNHIGLQHQVVTWSGGTTRLYVNGRKVAEKPYAWDTSNWSPEVPLLLGNQQDALRPFLGTYYLVAIHDRVLSDAQVLRHYQAGPSAR